MNDNDRDFQKGLILEIQAQAFNEGVSGARDCILTGLKAVFDSKPDLTWTMDQVIEMVESYEFTKLTIDGD